MGGKHGKSLENKRGREEHVQPNPNPGTHQNLSPPRAPSFYGYPLWSAGEKGRGDLLSKGRRCSADLYTTYTRDEQVIALSPRISPLFGPTSSTLSKCT